MTSLASPASDSAVDDPTPNPISRASLVRRLRNLGFEGPVTGGKHSYMIRGGQKVVIPESPPG